MKGIITNYRHDKGFGFIRDEHEQKRFFHISDVNEKEKFVQNTVDYIYEDWKYIICYVVSFTPGQNRKGLNATCINLTDQIFNDMSNQNSFEAEITDVRYNTESFSRVVSGVKKNASIPYGATSGGCGTYRIGFPEVFRELNIYVRRIDDIGWGEIEVRELVLNINDRRKVTELLVETLKNKLVGKIITIIPSGKIWKMSDSSILRI